jgi:putative endonuclease
MSRWYVYILRCRDKSLYTGITTDLAARLIKHNAGQGAAYTRSRKPVELVWFKLCRSESNARKQEYRIKTWSRADKEAFLLDQRAVKIGSPKR